MKDDLINKFNKKLATSNVIGCFSKTTDSSLVEVMGLAGMDFVILDMEHGPISYETLQQHIAAAGVSDLLPIVRVPEISAQAIGKVLDLGAKGIQVPSVTKKQQVLDIINFAKFHPIGHRGVCRFVRAAGFTHIDKAAYFEQANEALVVVQIEGVDGIKNFEEIISVTGIDIVFIGPYDLSQSLGCPGEIENPKVTNEIKKLIKIANERNVNLGTFCDTPTQLQKWRELGIKYLSYSVDMGIFYESLKEIKKY